MRHQHQHVLNLWPRVHQSILIEDYGLEWFTIAGQASQSLDLHRILSVTTDQSWLSDNIYGEFIHWIFTVPSTFKYSQTILNGTHSENLLSIQLRNSWETKSFVKNWKLNLMLMSAMWIIKASKVLTPEQSKFLTLSTLSLISPVKMVVFSKYQISSLTRAQVYISYLITNYTEQNWREHRGGATSPPATTWKLSWYENVWLNSTEIRKLLTNCSNNCPLSPLNSTQPAVNHKPVLIVNSADWRTLL